MKWIAFYKGILIAIGLNAIVMSSVQAGPFDALYRTEPTFFETGIEQFEREIERLTEPPDEEPILAIEESALFDPEDYQGYPGPEAVEESTPTSPDSIP